MCANPMEIVVMSGEVLAIYTRAPHEAEPSAKSSVTLEAGLGIVGDRNHGGNPDDQVTLVDADVIDAVNEATGWALSPAQTRRNIVTRGIDLNQWETGRFRVGGALLEGVELCEPCAHLGAMLQTDERSAADIVQALTHKGGLRARVLTGSDVAVGDRVDAAD